MPDYAILGTAAYVNYRMLLRFNRRITIKSEITTGYKIVSNSGLSQQIPIFLKSVLRAQTSTQQCDTGG